MAVGDSVALRPKTRDDGQRRRCRTKQKSLQMQIV